MIPTFIARAITNEFAKFTLQYGPRWSGTEEDGDPIRRDSLTAVDFYIKKKKTDDDYILHLSDANDNEIHWKDETEGIIEVLVGDNVTNSMAGKNLYWEVKVTFDSGNRETVGDGVCNLLASLENDTVASPSA